MSDVERMRAAAAEFVWLWDRYGDQMRATIFLGGWQEARAQNMRSAATSDAISAAAVNALVRRMREWADETDIPETG